MAVTQLNNKQIKDGTLVIADFSAAGTPSATTYLRGDNTWATPAGGGGSFALTTVEVSLGTTPKRSGKFNITSSGLTSGKAVLITQANGPYTDKGTRADEAEMDMVIVTGKTTSTTNIECYWNSRWRVWKNFKFDYIVSA